MTGGVKGSSLFRILWGIFLLGLPALVFPSPVLPAELVSLSRTMKGKVFYYRVRKGDFLLKIRGRFGVPLSSLIRSNALKDPDRIMPGQRLVVDNRHIVPEWDENGILINIPQKMLFFFSRGSLVIAAPVAVGMSSWPTPTGPFRVVEKKVDPVWVVPVSIQKEMKRLGGRVRKKVLPGPDDPLGKYKLGLDLSGYGIHGTNAPSSIYGFTTHGCIRLWPDDIEALFHKVPTGTRGEIIYTPILVESSAGGHVYLEIHPDVYHPGSDLAGVFDHWVDRHPELRIDRAKARRALLEEEGRPVDVTGP